MCAYVGCMCADVLECVRVWAQFKKKKKRAVNSSKVAAGNVRKLAKPRLEHECMRTPHKTHVRN